MRQGWGQLEDAILTTAMFHNTLKRPNTIRFSVRHNRPTAEQIHDNTINCIAELDNSWYNVTFNNERYCETIATSGLEVNGMLIDCERADIYHSVVVYVKAPYEMSDNVVANALIQYGTVANIRRQHHLFDDNIENGVRSLLIKHIKKPIPSFVRVGNFNLPVRHRGQEKTCKICQKPGIWLETVTNEAAVSYVALKIIVQTPMLNPPISRTCDQ